MPPTHQNESKEHWLSRYASNYHKWTLSQSPSQSTFSRPLGLVELSFDLDGTLFGGRADMNNLLSLEIATSLPSTAALRKRIALAWANLSAQHVLLMSRVRDDENGRREFVIDVPVFDAEDVVKKVESDIVWMDEWFKPDEINEGEFYKHCMNVARVLDVTNSTFKVYALPARKVTNHPEAEDGVERYDITFLIILAHQISDALSAHNWWRDFMKLLNTPEVTLKESLQKLLTVEEIESRLPPAQEDLYPTLSPSPTSSASSPSNNTLSLPRLRWYWAVLIILRSLRKPLPPSIPNPLYRRQRLEGPIALPQKYPQLFDYSPSAAPPMSSHHISAQLSAEASARLVRLCRSIGVSIGAGCFALVGLAMMELHQENQLLELQEEEKKKFLPLPFTASFPLNPRPFFGLSTPITPDSCMLAFSEGIVMPYLPSSTGLPIEARFKLVAKRANVELKTYQKRRLAPSASTSGTSSAPESSNSNIGTIFDPHDPKRLLATGYLTVIERVLSRLPPSRRHNFPTPPPSPLKSTQTATSPPPVVRATCGVSSFGSTSAFLRRGEYDLNIHSGKEPRDFAADYRASKQGVRARDNEFLVGCLTDEEGRVVFGVSYDWSAIAEDEAERWKECIEGLLEVNEKAGERESAML
ncbi:hypothetical protein DM02DRAFT_596449 [Periconia macrospinosa]|uniref:Uncharacterized protein n=1 Tax=Periconia macrospinosa TaxID=97972 RepID=A0A2V1DJX0_9PLEO|nr:hypothetical protein DM02DRAFT_596449 [Periconia macrospinosa]